jgi:hypothetical protein
MTQLSAVPCDILHGIISLIDARDIFHLIYGGSKALNRNLSVASTILSFRFAPFTLFPFPAYRFPCLAELSIGMIENVLSYPLTLRGSLPLPIEPIPTLQKLKFDFLQSYTLFSPSLPISTLFPNLTSLEVIGSTFSFEQHCLENLPHQLRYLRLVILPEFAYSLHHINQDVFTHLPDTLETLIMNVATIDEPNDKLFVPKFPSALRHLNLARINGSSMIVHLPPSMEYLELAFSPPSGVAEVLPLSSFPQTLKVLKLHSWYNGLEIKVDAPLPPLLTDVQMGLRLSDPTMASFLLPKSLTSCTLSSDIYAIPDLANVLPNLTTLDQAQTHVLTSALPPKLKRLSVFTAGILPSHDPLPPLPSTLIDLSYDVVTIDQFNALPSNLEALRLYGNPYPPVRPHLASWQRISENITKLSLNLSYFQSKQCLLCFTKLTTSSFQSPLLYSACHMNLSFRRH